jgi:RHS repeat-associated protein
LYDPHTRLVRFGARDYDASIGRWMAKDPIGFAAESVNLFAYSANSPTWLFDADGLAVAVCWRYGHGFPFREFGHEYFLDKRNNATCGKGGSLGMGGRGENESQQEKGTVSPEIPCSDGKEDCVMSCCRRDANRGIWVPFVNDCFNLIEHCEKNCCLQIFHAGPRVPWWPQLGPRYVP